MSKNNYPDIRYLFEPRSIAVIGASRDSGKIGSKVLENIMAGGYEGRIYPVNSTGGELMGLQAYDSVEAVEGDVDVASIVVPAHRVLSAVESCARKKVKFLMVVSSGFSEVGNMVEEKKIALFAREQGMRIMGPNMFGLYSASSSLNATFGPKEIRAGGVAIITQSGALGLAMIGKTSVKNIGLSTICSVGNKSDLDEADLLEYLVPHEDTKVILMYIEGVKKGEKFIGALKRATQVKPVVVVKSGRSKRGAAAAASHTGSLAGADNVFNAIMMQCGVLRAETIKEAFDWCSFMSNNSLPDGQETVIITNGGGIGVMATDASEKYGVSLYDDPAMLKKIFSPATPEFGSLKNPIDITGQAQSIHYDTALDAALHCDDIHSAVALYCETAVFDAEKLPVMVKNNYEKFRKSKKPILFSLFGGENTERCVTEMSKEQVPVYGDVYEAVSPLGAMYSYRRYLANYVEAVDTVDFDVDAVNLIIDRARSEKRYFLLTDEAQEIMKIARVPIPKTVIVRSLVQAVNVSREIGYPVVMKVVSKDIIHKSDAGGVALDLVNEKEVIDAYEAIMRNCKAKVPEAQIEGVEVTEMVSAGTEIIAGAKIDPSFGPIVMVGLGGIYVEVMRDVTFRAHPLNRGEVLSMIEQIRSYPLLLGVRGEKTKDIGSLVDIILTLGSIVQKCRGITDIEINPVMVYEQGAGAKAVDVRILLSKDERGGTHE